MTSRNFSSILRMGLYAVVITTVYDKSWYASRIRACTTTGALQVPYDQGWKWEKSTDMESCPLFPSPFLPHFSFLLCSWGLLPSPQIQVGSTWSGSPAADKRFLMYSSELQITLAVTALLQKFSDNQVTKF